MFIIVGKIYPFHGNINSVRLLLSKYLPLPDGGDAEGDNKTVRSKRSVQSKSLYSQKGNQ